MAKEDFPNASLPNEINTATRSLHTELNRLITARLPLALPPFAGDPTLYTTGLLHFAHIYLTFESLWNDLLPSNVPGSPTSPPTSPLLSFLLVNPYSEPELFSSPPSPQMVGFLQSLRPKGLARAARLKRDLEYLSGLHPTDFDVLLAQYPGDKVAEFCTHIRRRVGNKPHVLVAYAWCYYMAVFSGGRWIRSELLKAGIDFWKAGAGSDVTSDAEGLRSEEKGLSFWSFPGQQDGLDIKEAFKMRLLAAETLLTPDQRIDVIEEAKIIFKLSAGLVQELDEKLGTDLERRKHADAMKQHQAEKESDKVSKVTLSVSKSAVGTWVHKPEVTGVALALGCLACVALLRFGY